MFKKVRVYICDNCGKMEKPQFMLTPIEVRRCLPDNWGRFAQMDLCDKCYTKIKRLFEEDEDARNKQNPEAAG